MSSEQMPIDRHGRSHAGSDDNKHGRSHAGSAADKHGRHEAIRREALPWFAIVALIVAVNLIVYWRQQPITLNDGLGWDGPMYALVAVQFAEHTRPATSAPYVYRVGAPWIAAHMPGPDTIANFWWLDWGAANASALLMVVWLRRQAGPGWAWTLPAALFVLQWHAPLRRFYYYSIHADFLAVALMLLGLLLVDLWRERRASVWWILLLLLVPGAAVVHDSLVLLPIAALGATNPASTFFTRQWPWRARWAGFVASLPCGASLPAGAAIALWIAPLLAAAVAIALVRGHVRPADAHQGAYYGRYAWEMLLGKSSSAVLLGWAIAFGPVLAAIGLTWRGALAWVSQRQHLALWLAGIVLLGFIGGIDTERIVYWSAPVVYGWFAVALGSANLNGLAARAGWIVWGVSQAVSQRLFWSLPDTPSDAPHRLPLLTVWSESFPVSDLFSYSQDTQTRLLLGAQYAVLFLVLGLLWRGTWNFSSGAAGPLPPGAPPAFSPDRLARPEKPRRRR